MTPPVLVVADTCFAVFSLRCRCRCCGTVKARPQPPPGLNDHQMSSPLHCTLPTLTWRCQSGAVLDVFERGKRGLPGAAFRTSPRTAQALELQLGLPDGRAASTSPHRRISVEFCTSTRTQRCGGTSKTTRNDAAATQGGRELVPGRSKYMNLASPTSCTHSIADPAVPRCQLLLQSS